MSKRRKDAKNNQNIYNREHANTNIYMGKTNHIMSDVTVKLN